MKNYFLIFDSTLTIRLVDNSKWLNSEKVTLLETIMASSYSEAIKQVERNYNFKYSAELHHFTEK